MTRPQKSAKLIGWIKLIPHGEGYGIPIFKGKGNADLIPQTDDDLIITKFSEYYNESNYHIERSLPNTHENKEYNVGDNVPIPFNIKQITVIVESGTDMHLFLSRYADNHRSSVIERVAAILHATSTGEYKIRNTKIAAEIFLIDHDEVLSGEPAHSAYWVQRLGVAVRGLNLIPHKNRGIAHNLVVERASAWLKLYGSNSDLPMLLKVLKALENVEDAYWKETSENLFLSIIRRIDSRSITNKDMSNLILKSRKWLPKGLYGFYIEHGLPEGVTRRDQEQAKDLPGLLVQMVRDDDRSGSFKRSLAAAGAIFSDSDLPSWVANIVQVLAYTKLTALHTSAGLSANPRVPSKKLIYVNPEYAKKMLKENNNIITLYRILHGQDRLEYYPSTKGVRYGLSSMYVDTLKSIIDDV